MQNKVADLQQAVSEYYPVSYGQALYDAVVQYQPNRIIEFGPGHGFTTLCLALGLQTLGRGEVHTYDLWDARLQDVFKQKTRSMFSTNVERFPDYLPYITAAQRDFWEWLKEPEPFDMLYLDINNDGEIIKRAAEMLRPQLKAGAVVLFEGGIPERDRVPKHNERPDICAIRDVVGYSLLCSDFPGLGIIKR